MKHYFYITFVSFLFGSHSILADERTAELAVELGYPQLMVTLRNKAQEFLAAENVRLMLNVDDLRKLDRNYRAEALSDRYHTQYEELEQIIDTTFEEVNQQFINEEMRLDEHDATDKEKREFITRMKKIAVQRIEELLKQKVIRTRNNPANVDF